MSLECTHIIKWSNLRPRSRARPKLSSRIKITSEVSNWFWCFSYLIFLWCRWSVIKVRSIERKYVNNNTSLFYFFGHFLLFYLLPSKYLFFFFFFKRREFFKLFFSFPLFLKPITYGPKTDKILVKNNFKIIYHVRACEQRSINWPVANPNRQDQQA